MFGSVANVSDVQGSPKNDLAYGVQKKNNKQDNNIKVGTFLKEMCLSKLRIHRKQKKKKRIFFLIRLKPTCI